MATTSADSPSGLINLAGLVSTLAPIFLGGGNQTTTTSGGKSSTTQNSSTTSGNSPDILSSLVGNVNTAISNSQDSSKTDALVADIMRQSAIAFAPTLAASNSAGLYNSSTLNLLSNNAKATATSASTKAVLDYQTGQQQIANQGLATIANNNKTAATSTTTDTQQSPSSTFTIKAPQIDPLTSLLTLGGGILGPKLLESKLAGTIGDSITTLFGGVPSSTLTNFATTTGIAGPATASGVGASAIDLGGAGGFSEAPGAAFTSLDLSEAPGAIFADTAADASGLIGADAGAEALAGIGGGAVSLEGGADLAAGVGAFGDIASDAAIAGGAGLAEGAGGLAAGLTAAELAGSGLELGGAGALAAGFASDAAIAGGAGAAASAGGIGSFFAGIGEVLAAILPVLGWIICTELKNQGKMSITLYRYGLIHFNNYPEFGKLGYLLWARPVRDYIHKYPGSKVTTFMAWIFNKRVNNIAANAGCKIAKWTFAGFVVYSIVNFISFLLGLVILPFSSISSVKNYFASTSTVKENI